MKDLLKIFIVPFLFITIAFGQIVDVSDYYQSDSFIIPHFEKIGGSHDFPHFRISSLIEDHEGFLWIGTKDGGLIKYDGYEFSSFELNPTDPFSLSSNDVYFVFEDSRNMLWVGTDDGLSYYHPLHKQFIKVLLANPGHNTLSPRNLTAIVEAENGNLLIGTNIGIFEISNIKKELFINQKLPQINQSSVKITIKHILIQSDDPLITGKIICDIRFDNDKNLLILTDKELGHINYKELIQSQEYIQNEKKIYGNYSIIANIEDGKRISFDNNGVPMINNDVGVFRILKQNNNHIVDEIDFSSNTNKTDDPTFNNSTESMYWVGYYDDKLKLYNKDLNSYYSLTFNTGRENNLHDYGISCFLRTHSGVIFIGTAWGGLYKYNPNDIFLNYHPKLQSIHQNQRSNLRFVYEDSDGYIWIVAEDIYRFNKFTGEIIQTFTSDFFNQKWSYTNNIIEDKNGRFWIGMESRGLFYLDIKNEKVSTNNSVKTTNYKQIIKGKTITALHENSDGSIFAGTIFSDPDSAKTYTELYRLSNDGKIQSIYPITNCYIRNGNEIDQFINQIYIDESNCIWLASGFGLVKIDRERDGKIIFSDVDENTSSIGENRLLSICPDPFAPDSILWLGYANRGLRCFNKVTNLFCSGVAPFNLKSNHIASILPDNKGNLWLGSDKGIQKISVSEKGGEPNQISIYDNSDGLITGDFTNYYGPNAVKSKQGKLIFTGPRGFQFINPDSEKENQEIPYLHITDFTVNYNPADFGQPESPLSESISLTKKISLPYYQNTLGFEMTAIDFKAPAHLRYAFILKNYNNDWVDNNNNRVIQYTKLPPGNYDLMIKVSTRDGKWSEEKIALEINIQNPWWTTTFAYIIYFLIFIGGVLIVDKIQRYRHNMKLVMQLNQVEADKLRELDLMKSKFFANISHEFKTPLTLIINPIDEMLNKPDEKVSPNTLFMIKRNAIRLQQYITEILELSKLDANRLRLSIRELDIVKYLKYHVASFESLANLKDISIKLTSPEKEIICYLDPEKMNTIISNLLSNAIKFTPKGGKVEIILSGCFCNEHEHCTQKKGCLSIIIKDNGIGIPENKIPYIFDRYYKAVPDSTGNENGTGLGLALVKELVNLHHGTINVVSKENKFTMFQVHFPMGRYHVQPADLVNNSRYEVEEDFDILPKVTTEISTKEAVESQDLNLKIVLFIEDNKDMRTLISVGLKREFKVILATNGEEGIKIAIETSPDLILCDVMMPKKDGFEVARTLKANEITSHIPIIFLTAKSQVSDKITGLEIGADDYLIKPFSPLELKARVKNLLEQREKLREKYSKFNVLKLDKLPVKSIDQVFLEKVIKNIETNLADENFGVQTLLKDLNISRTQLHRKLKALVNQSANELIQSIRLQKASELLKNNSGTVAEICYKVGFSSPPYFTRLFKQQFGHTPSQHSNL